MYLVNLINVLVLIVISSLYSMRVKNLMNPLLFFNLSVGISYLLYFFIFKSNYAISTTTLIVFLEGQFFFNFGYLILNFIPIVRNYSNVQVKHYNNGILMLFLFIGILGYIDTVKYFHSFGSLSNNGIGSAVRDAYVTATNLPFLVTYGKYFLIFSAMVYWYRYLINEKKKKKDELFVYVLMFLSVSVSFFTQSRTDLLISIVPFVILYFKLDRNKKKIKKYIIVGAIMMVLFAGITTLRNQNDKGVKFFSQYNASMQYVGYPLIAFDRWIVNSPHTSDGFTSVEPVEKVLVATGKSNQMMFAQLGQFNVYSYLENPYLDFGMLGVIAWMTVLGMLFNLLFRFAMTEKTGPLLFYSLASYSLIIAFFAWQFTIMTFLYFILFWISITVRLVHTD